jgi:hypothetical protein
MIQDSILVCSPDPRIPHTALYEIMDICAILWDKNDCYPCYTEQSRAELGNVKLGKEQFADICGQPHVASLNATTVAQQG